MTMTKARLGAEIARIGAHALWDRATRPQPLELSETPPSVGCPVAQC